MRRDMWPEQWTRGVGKDPGDGGAQSRLPMGRWRSSLGISSKERGLDAPHTLC